MAWTDLVSQIHPVFTNEMGQPAVYTDKADDSTYELDIIFSGEAVQLNAGPLGTEIESHAPIADLTLSDLPIAPKHLDEISFGGNSYRVIGIEPDGQGMASLALEVK